MKQHENIFVDNNNFRDFNIYATCEFDGKINRNCRLKKFNKMLSNFPRISKLLTFLFVA